MKMHVRAFRRVFTYVFLNLLICLNLYSSQNFNYTFNDSSDETFEYNNIYSPLVRPEEAYKFSKALSDVGVYPTREYFGDNIKIGIIENDFINDGYNNQLDDIVYFNSENNYDDSIYNSHMHHAINVATIIGGNASIARNSTLYSGAKSYSYTSNILDWMVEHDVDLVSTSLGLTFKDDKIEDGTYDQNSKSIDEFIYENMIPFVIAIGNRGENDFRLSSVSSLGLNALSVGSINENGNASLHNAYGSKDEYSPFTLTPKILAPGENLFDILGVNVNPNLLDSENLLSGTSFSTPIVAGIIGLLLEEFPHLKNHPELVIPLVCNTATKVNDQTDFVDSVHGFGLINYSEARKAANNTRTIVIPNNTPNNAMIYEELIEIGAGDSIDITSFTLFDPTNVYINTPYDLHTYASPETIDFSKIKIELVDRMTNLPVYSDNISNFSYLNYTNDLYTRTYWLRAYLDGEQKESSQTIVGLNFNIKRNFEPFLDIVSGNYLDECPTFEYCILNYQVGEDISLSTDAVFIDEFCDVLFKKEGLPSNDGTFQISSDEWADIIELKGREYYAYLEYSINGDIDFSKVFVFNEPTNFNNLLQILPQDFGFRQQYYSEVLVTNHTFDNVGVTATRKRCGYILNTYNVLSSKKTNEGEAFLQLEFDTAIYGYMIGLTMWSDLEGLYNFNSTIKLYNKYSDGTWHEELDLFEDVSLPMNRMDLYRYSMRYSIPIYGIKVVVTSEATGSSNKGRVCIDDIVLLRNSDEFAYTSLYESVVEDTEYYALRTFYID